MLCAGFPCQTFSIIGKSQGFENPRSRARSFASSPCSLLRQSMATSCCDFPSIKCSSLLGASSSPTASNKVLLP
ncbi:DNA cytosine methyltransferase, partial [Bacillus sp. SIMBA_154]|uniref:DNA cytosine methyltransferase n=1 Tax=Bacillus sp. SIMBA_154 TaxID=3080859 RepID=UPI0039788830